MADKNATIITAKPGEKEMVIRRIFEAPRELVYKAHVDPELLPQWWGPRKYTTTIDKLDLMPRGAWRFLHRDDEGHEYAFRGEFREVVPPERLTWTFEFEGMPGHVAIETVTFEEEAGKTKVMVTSVYPSVEDRDAVLESGMESGLEESYERLDELLQKVSERTTA